MDKKLNGNTEFEGSISSNHIETESIGSKTFRVGSNDSYDSDNNNTGESVIWIGPSHCIITRTDIILNSSGDFKIDLSKYGSGSFSGIYILSSDRLYDAGFIRTQIANDGEVTNTITKNDSKIYRPTHGIGEEFLSGNTTVSIDSNSKIITVSQKDTANVKINIVIIGAFSVN